MKKQTKTIFLPSGSSERFVSFDSFGGAEYFGKTVFLSALCSYPAGYYVFYPAPKRHLAVFCRSGSFEYSSGEESGVLSAGEFALMPAGECQTIKSTERSESMFFLLKPSPSWNFDRHLHSSTEEIELMWQLMEKAFRLNSAALDHAHQKSTLGTLLFDILKEQIHNASDDFSGFRLLLSKLIMTPQADWSVSKMAEFCGVSEPYFFVLCRKYYGSSPYSVLKKIRMEQAKQLLLSTSYPIKNIASLCGYGHQFSFSRSFKQQYGVSPEKFRESQS